MVMRRIIGSRATAAQHRPKEWAVYCYETIARLNDENSPEKMQNVCAGSSAGSSSRIENYLGFPTGISGLDLTGRAYSQALKFGAHIMVAKGASRLACSAQRLLRDP
jgi:hypothetical protein